MLKKILLALDGSENAEKALPWVKRMAGREKALVLLLQVLARHEDVEIWFRERTEARAYLGRLERELNYAGIPTRIMVRRGNASREIVAAAREEHCDLILMTTRGGSKVKRWVIGGTTEQVLRLTEVPVLPVSSQMPFLRQGRVSRVIVPVDGSLLAETAIDWGVELARQFKSKLILLHVHPEGRRQARWGVKAFRTLQARMARVCRRLTREGVRAVFAVQRGDPATRIVVYADAHDLILTTTHGEGGFKRWIFGSVAEKVIHEAHVPVLVYKASLRSRTKVLRA